MSSQPLIVGGGASGHGWRTRRSTNGSPLLGGTQWNTCSTPVWSLAPFRSKSTKILGEMLRCTTSPVSTAIRTAPRRLSLGLTGGLNERRPAEPGHTLALSRSPWDIGSLSVVDTATARSSMIVRMPPARFLNRLPGSPPMSRPPRGRGREENIRNDDRYRRDSPRRCRRSAAFPRPDVSGREPRVPGRTTTTC